MALIQRPLDADQAQQIKDLHRRFIVRHPTAVKLHCVYVPVADIGDVATQHVTWAAQSMFWRPFSGIARAELLRYGATVFGPAPYTVIPAVCDSELREAVRRDITGYWRRALRRPSIWLQDFYVDLSLLTLARAEATLANGELITKREGLARLEHFNVPVSLREQIERRRLGQPTRLSLAARVHRARLVHHIVSDGIRSLLAHQGGP